MIDAKTTEGSTETRSLNTNFSFFAYIHNIPAADSDIGINNNKQSSIREVEDDSFCKCK